MATRYHRNWRWIVNEKEPWTAGVDHVGLAVESLPDTREFFTECLGWKIVAESATYRRFSCPMEMVS
ncbi:VOC family protein [Bradyrhizobium sp. USDA 3256]